MLALGFSITLGRTRNVDYKKSQIRATLAGYYQGFFRRAVNLSGFIPYGVESPKGHFITGVKNYTAN